MEIKNIKSTDAEKLPDMYISFSDDLEYALRQLKSAVFVASLKSRGMVVIEPHNIFRVEYMSETKKPHYMLAFELRKEKE